MTAPSKPKRRRPRVFNPVGSPHKSPKAVVQQHFKKETDINAIVERARRGIPPTNVRDRGAFVDLSNMPHDLTEAFARVESAWDSFQQLPAKAREELSNDPRNLFKVTPDFLVRHGLAKARTQSPETAQGSPGGAGEGSPAKASKKPSKEAPKAPTPDHDDQD